MRLLGVCRSPAPSGSAEAGNVQEAVGLRPPPPPPTPILDAGLSCTHDTTVPGSCQSVGLFVADSFYLGVLISTK